METEKINCSGGVKPPATPCAACKILRRRCGDKCLLAPYFPTNSPHKFATAHHVFGASNIIKMLKDLPNDARADAVNSMVYEANARVRDPVYGCAGTVSQLQHQISQLQSQVAAAQAELLNLRIQQANFLSLLTLTYTSKEDAQTVSPSLTHPPDNDNENDLSGEDVEDLFSDDVDPLMLWKTQ
ncbi:hypothetical protein SUGI_0321550 [Cryptomeria japonica]|uniref:LOB domain-containing protein 4 n=1 Tax=Cryptomeria japonica TaxID=3369 RepID=UPI002408B86E|nr:LOB domain-containing protein 4 [Cryptomeria japonica]GLJ18189.1 hypothetical protein SUGI_0321550 [Cryptomeria japonica]